MYDTLIGHKLNQLFQKSLKCQNYKHVKHKTYIIVNT